MFKFLKTIILTALTLGVLGAIVGLGIFLYFGRGLPDYQQLANYDPPIVTRMHADDGKLFAEYAKEKRVFVPISAIPKHIIKTFLAVEDKNFYHHFGLDFISLLRALGHNIYAAIKKQHSLMGGSTITQQVAKNFLLSHERTITRKIQEAILSFRIERTFSKDKILELYLNEIYLGSGVYGVAAAALHYFNKSLDELTIAEAAFLAALPKAPNNYHPLRHPGAAIDRRNWVIARMLEEGIISPAEALESKKQPIILRTPSMASTVHAQYFAEEVRRHIVEKYGQEALYKGGLSIRTTLDSRLQKIADQVLRQSLIDFDHQNGWRGGLGTIDLKKWDPSLKAFPTPKGIHPWELAVVLRLYNSKVIIGLKNGRQAHILFDSMKWARKHFRSNEGMPYLGPPLTRPADILTQGKVILVSKATPSKPLETYTLEQSPEVQGALVALDPHTGRVLALSGGFSYERSEFNRATQAQRQPGSAFKPFVYLTALENGYTPTSHLLDAPFSIDLGKGLGIWSPKNIEKTFFGTNTLRTALERSFNATMVRLAHTMGMKKIAETAKKFHIYDALPLQLSAVLGAEALTLLRFTMAYGMLVNGGKEIHPIFIDRIQDRQGKTIFKSDTRVCSECINQPWDKQLPPDIPTERAQVADPISAYQVVSILEGAVERGTGRRAKVQDQIVAVKTGTSNDNKDTWTLGFSKDLVVGVYVGLDNCKSLGSTATGGTVAAPIFSAFMKEALKGKPASPFRVPANAKFVRIDRATGKPAAPHDTDTILEVFKPDQEASQQEDATGVY